MYKTAQKTAASLRRFNLIEVMRIRQVPVYVHWTLAVVIILILCGAVERPGFTAVILCSYIGVLLIHECGHLIAAHLKGCRVLSIKLYPIFGVTCFEQPWSRWDSCVIAWGGVIAQAVVAFPFITWYKLFGFARFDQVNALIAILGFFSVGIALFNLLPVPPLDGATAWGIVPALFGRSRIQKSEQLRKWRHR
jgi:membrane-associated protease RseP (regulator of RpoE activity)